MSPSALVALHLAHLERCIDIFSGERPSKLNKPVGRRFVNILRTFGETNENHFATEPAVDEVEPGIHLVCSRSSIQHILVKLIDEVAVIK